MKGTVLRLASLSFISITQCMIRKEMNTHGSARIEGIIHQSDERKVMSILTSKSMEQIILIDEENIENVLFSGLVESAKVEVEGQLCKASFQLVGGTKYLDIVKKTRTFQNENMTYEQLLNLLESDYSECIHCSDLSIDSTIGNILVQYKETDWEFMKRIASHFNTCVYPYFQTKSSRYYIGIPDYSNGKKIDVTKYSVENLAQEYQFKVENGVTSLIDEDAIVYYVETKEAFELGDKVILNGNELWVAQIEAKLQNAELIYNYHLKKKNAISVVKSYNKQLIGASLQGCILDIQNDKVKVHISEDSSQNIGEAKWFSYSTVYSSPDGTGWYCMPEKNDRVRLYFPNEKEEDGYIISSIHESTGSSDTTRKNPDNKSLSTKYGKQVELTPTSITMTNNKGMMVKMDDETGICLISNKDIVFESEAAINIISTEDTMSLTATDSIELIQGNAKMTMKDDIKIEGAQFKMQ